MRAVIMAGGEGTRLRPLTCCQPKPMVDIANKPVMEYTIELLKKHNIDDIAVTLQYMPDHVKDYFGDGREFGVKMKYYEEKTPLGTAGSVKNAEELLDDTFLVISGDALTDINITEAIEFHKARKSYATLILKKVDIPLEYGVVVTEEDGRITRFLEKPSWGEVFSDTANTGIYILSPYVLSYFGKNEKFDFSKDLFPLLLRDKIPMYGYVTEDYWCDVGDIKAYLQANEDVLNGKVNVSIKGKEIAKGVWLGAGSHIDESALISSPCIIGDNCRIGKNVKISDSVVIGDNCIIEEGSSIKKSVVWENSYLSKNIQLRGSIVGERVYIKDRVSAFEGSVIGNYSTVEERATISPNIKIWPDKIVEQGAKLNSNFVWGSSFSSSIFGNRGITGDINIDITPEFATRLGASFGSIKNENSKIAISCDGSSASEMIKIALSAGMLSAGVEVYDFGKTLLPVTRTAVRFYRLNGGIYVSSSSFGQTKVIIDFLDQNGGNIDRNTERKIENIFKRDDFRRCEGKNTKSIIEVKGYSHFYIKGLVNKIKSDDLKYKIALLTPSRLITKTISDMLSELGCELVAKSNSKWEEKDNETGDVKDFARYVKKGAFDIGVSIEGSAEKMLLVDDKGRMVTEDMFTALVSLIIFRSVEGSTVVVPVSASNVIERIADLNNGKVVRCKTSDQDIMGQLLSSGDAEEFLEQFAMHYDAVAGLVSILDFMKRNKCSLSELVDMIPEFYMAQKVVECPWNAKGKVIREIIQENAGQKVETLDGVKVYNDKGWVMVLPDGERPLCKVISESSTVEFAEELASIYIEKIKDISSG
jgi:mannose-1-phosphate guanylyltransferase/phosphomannomutase